MLEKKFVVYDLRLSYNGPVNILDFYKEVEDWMKEKGLEKDMRKHMDHRTSEGRQIEWHVECWKDITEWAREVVRLRAMFNHVKDITIEKNGRKIKMQTAEVLLIFDGILEANLSRRWEQQNIFYFLRNLFDKYVLIGTNPAEKYFGVVWDDTHDMFKRLKGFFNIYKTKAD